MHIGNTLMWQCGNVAMWHFDSTSHPLQDANTVFWMLQICGLPVANIWFTNRKYMLYSHLRPFIRAPAPLSPLKMASVSHKVLMSLIRC